MLVRKEIQLSEQMSSLFSVIRHLSAFSFVLLMVLYVFEAQLAATRALNISSYKVAKEGCRGLCGDVRIPYPFGVTSDCYRDKRFKVACNYDDSSFTLSLEVNHDQYEVSEITQDYVRISTVAPAFCEVEIGRSNSSARNWSTPSLKLTQTTVSNTLNQFIVLGCNIQGYINTYDGKLINPSECATQCYYEGMESLCYGCGSCSTTVPKGPLGYSYTIQTSKFEDGNFSSTDLCIHAFLAENDFSGIDDLMLSRAADSYVPVIWDWAITDYALCEEAQRNRSSYICGINSYSFESDNGPGYRCKCSDGYEGNPYLLDGCQDECKETQKCGSEALCNNTPRSYNCSCSPGKKLGINNMGYYCIPDKRRLPIAAFVASGIGVIIVLVIMVGMCYCFRKRFEKGKQMKLKKGHFTRNGKVEKAAKIFITEELEKITDNFNPSRIIGKGGFGTVYKGMSSDGEIVAIKKSTFVDATQIDQFINEVVILSQMNHRHIVKLLGCCLETEVPLLVYEFAPNGTLSYHLHLEEGDFESTISLKDRVRIAYEVAGALAYLHSDAAMPIFHRDIKSTNIDAGL